MLYTVMPMEVVFGAGVGAGPGAESSGKVADANIPVQVMVAGSEVLGYAMPDGGVRVERLLSTDPAHYLRPDLCPGCTVYGAQRCQRVCRTAYRR